MMSCHIHGNKCDKVRLWRRNNAVTPENRRGEEIVMFHKPGALNALDPMSEHPATNRRRNCKLLWRKPLTSASCETVSPRRVAQIIPAVGSTVCVAFPSASADQTSHVDGKREEAPTLIVNALRPTCAVRVHFQPTARWLSRQTSPN